MSRIYGLLEKDTQCAGRNRVRRTRVSEEEEERNTTASSWQFKEKTGQKITLLINI